MINLRNLKESDSDLFFVWINDRDLVSLSAPFREIGRAEHDHWFESVRNKRPDRIFAIAASQDESTIGYCQLLNVHEHNRSAELRIRIGDRAWQGRGAGTEAVRLLLRHGFGVMGLHRIDLHVFDSNVRARRAYARNGFIVEGMLRQAVLIEGKYEDVTIMGVLRAEFQALDARA